MGVFRAARHDLVVHDDVARLLNIELCALHIVRKIGLKEGGVLPRNTPQGAFDMRQRNRAQVRGQYLEALKTLPVDRRTSSNCPPSLGCEFAFSVRPH